MWRYTGNILHLKKYGYTIWEFGRVKKTIYKYNNYTCIEFIIIDTDNNYEITQWERVTPLDRKQVELNLEYIKDLINDGLAEEIKNE